MAENSHPDMFGGETPVVQMPTGGESRYQRFRRVNRYRKAPAGSGRKCETCTHFMVHRWDKKYFKCARMGDSRSTASDIRARGVCDLWEATA